MSSYDSYVSRIEKIAKVKNFVVKHKIAFIAGASAAVVLSASMVSTKGIIVQDVVIPDSIVYGSSFEFEKEAVGLFGSKVYYEFRLEGEEEWVSEKPTKPGNYQVRAVSKNSFGGNIYGKEIDFVIGSKDITIVVDDKTIPYGTYENISYTIYDGILDEIPNNKNNASIGLVGSDYIKEIEFEFEDTSKENTKVRANVDSVSIFNDEGNDISELYSVHTLYKDIKFEKRDIVLRPEQVTKLYDGLPIEYNNEYSTYTEKQLAEGDHLTLDTVIKSGDDILSSNPKEAGTYIVSIEGFRITNSEGNDVSKNYSVSYEGSLLVISKRELSITSSSASKTYDGTYLTSFDYETYEGELLDNHIIVYDPDAVENNSKIKDVKYLDGEISYIENNVKYSILDENNVDCTKNYIIRNIPGKLSILPLEYSLSPIKQSSFTYNKQVLSYLDENNNFIEINGKLLPEDVSLKINVKYYDIDDNEYDSVINAGVYRIVIKDFILIGDNRDNYIFSTNEEEFEIYKRGIYLNTVSIDDYIYDGKQFLYDKGSYVAEHKSNLDISILEGNSVINLEDDFDPIAFLEGDGVTISVNYLLNEQILSIAPKDVGTYGLVIDDFIFSNDTMNGNYNIVCSSDINEYNIVKRKVSIYADSLVNQTYNKEVQDLYDKTKVLYEDDSLKFIEEDKFVVEVEYKYVDGSEEMISSPKNAHEYHIYIKNVIFDDPINENNYEIVYSNTKYGEYTILPKEITLKAMDLDNIVYDGEIHNQYDENEYEILNNDSFFEDDGVTVTIKFYNNAICSLENVVNNPRNAGSYYLYINDYNYINDTMNGNYNIILSKSLDDVAHFEILKREVTLKAVDIDSNVYNGLVQDTYDNKLYTYDKDSNDMVDNIVVSYKYVDEQKVEIEPKNAQVYGIILYDITFEDLDNEQNYIINFSLEASHYEITKKELVITSVDKEIKYGSKFIDREVNYKGFVNGEDESVLSGTLNIDTNYVQYDDVDTYDIFASGYTSQNYDIIFENGILNVTKATLVNKTSNYEEIYDGKEHFLDFKFEGLVSNNSDYPEGKIEELHQVTNISLDGINYSNEYSSYKDVCEKVTIYYILSFKNYENIKSSNYIMITKRTLVIKAKDVIITYGDDIVKDYEATGWAEGEGIGVLKGSLQYTVNYNKFDDIDPNKEYRIKPYGLYSDNYDITYVDGKLTINKATLVDDSSSYEGMYDGEEHSVSISAIGFLNGENFVDVATISYSRDGIDYSSDIIKLKDFNETPLVVHYIISFTNYNDIVGSKTIKINKAILKIIANDHSIMYGSDPSNNGVYFEGFYGSDSEILLDLDNMNYSYSYQKFDPIGYYTITPSNVSDILNYHIVFESGTLEVTPFDAEIIWGDTSLVYNGLAQAPEAYIMTFNGDICKVSVSGLNIICNDNDGDAKYVAIAYALDNPNYSIGSNAEIEYVIVKKNLTAYPTSKTITFGQDFDLSGVSVSYSGFVGDDDESVVSGTVQFTTTYVKFLPVCDAYGQEIPYTISLLVDELTADNYKVVCEDSRLYVKKAAISDASSGFDVVYDGSYHYITLDATGFINSDTFDNQLVKKLFKYDENGSYEPLDTPARRYYTGEDPIVVYYQIEFRNYETIYGSVTMVISQKTLVVTAIDNSITYGDLPSGNGVTCSGFIDGEGLDEINNLFGLDYDFDYNQFDPVGNSYTITPKGLSSSHDNYKFEYVSGTLSVNQKEIDVLWSSETNLVYSGMEQIITASAVGLLNGDECEIIISGKQVNVGDYIATITGISNDNYCLKDGITLTHSFSIIKASLYVYANNHSIIYGDNISFNGVIYRGFVGDDDESCLKGTLSLETNYNRYDNIGKYVITASGLIADNYNIVYEDGELSVNSLEVEFVWSETKIFTYDANEHCREATIANLVNGDTCTLVIEGKQINAGNDYFARVTSLGNSNYCLPEENYATFTIKKATLVDESFGYEGVYDGDFHTITVRVSGFVGSDDESCGTISYGTTSACGNSSNLRKAHVSESGIVYYRVTYDNYETISGYCNVNILPKELTDISLDYNGDYDAQNHGIKVDLSGFVDGSEESLAKKGTILYSTIEGNPYNLTINPTYKDCGEYTVYYSITFKYGDYKTVTGSRVVKINKRYIADESENYEGYYNGTSHGIFVFATPISPELFNNVATITYSLEENGTYTSTPIKFTNYTPDPVVVYYKITFANYQDIIGSKTINIKQRELYVYSNDVTITYGEVPTTGNGIYYGPNPSDKEGISGFYRDENAAQCIDESNLSYDFSSYTRYQDVGEYLFKAQGLLPKDADKDNYKFVYQNATLLVKPKEVEVSWNDPKFVYNGEEQYPIATASGFVNGDSFELESYVSATSSLPIKACETYNPYIAYARFKEADDVINYVLPKNCSKSYVIEKLTIKVSPYEFAPAPYNGKYFSYDSSDYNNFDIASEEFDKIGHNKLDKILIYVYFKNNETNEIYESVKNVGSYLMVISSFKVSYFVDEVEYDFTESYNIILDEERNYVINKLPILIDANKMSDIEFDGNNHYYDSNFNNYKLCTGLSDELIANIASDLMFSVDVKFVNVSTEEELSSIRNAGTYKIVIIPNENYTSNNIDLSYCNFDTTTAVAKITPKEVPIDLEAQEKSYDGEEFKYSDIDLIAGDKIKLNVIYDKIKEDFSVISNDVTPINAGYYLMKLDEDSTWYELVLTSLSIEGNYKIVLGVDEELLTILKRDIYIKTIDEVSGEYDGQEHGYTGGYEYYGASVGNPKYQIIGKEEVTLSVAYDGSISKPVNAGTYNVTIDPNASIIKISGEETTLRLLENYEVHCDLPSTFTIRKRLVGILPEKIDDKTYDKFLIQANSTGFGNFIYDTSVSSNELVSGEKLEIKVEYLYNGSYIELYDIIDAGRYSYIGSINDTSSLNISNYEFVFNYAYFEINRRDIYITPSQMDSVVYDFKEHKYLDQYRETDYTYYGASITNPINQFVSGDILSISVFLNDSAAVIDAGEYLMSIDGASSTITCGERVYNASLNYNIIVEGAPQLYFKILQKELTIGPKDHTYTYDGNVFKYEDYAYAFRNEYFVIDGLIEDDILGISDISFIYKFKGEDISPVNCGTYAIYLDMDNTHISKNYKLKSGLPAELVIVKRKIVINVDGLQVTYSNKVYNSEFNEYSDVLYDDKTKPGFVIDSDRNAFKVVKYVYLVDNEEVDPINAGDYDISLSYVFTDANVENNYEIVEINEGLLTIEKRKVCVVPHITEDDYKVYDGEEFVYVVENGNFDYFGETLDICEGHELKIKVAFLNAIAIGLHGEEINLNEYYEQDFFFDSVIEAAKYKVSAYEYLINGEINPNYDFSSDFVSYEIYRREIKLFNGDYEFIYNGKVQKLTDLDDLEIDYLNNHIADQNSVDFLSSLNYKAYIASGEGIEEFINVNYNEMDDCFDTYLNKAFIRLFMDDYDKTYNFIIEVEQGTITVLPCAVDFVIDVPTENAKIKFTSKPFDFEIDNFRIETLCNNQVLRITEIEEFARGIIDVGIYTIDDINYLLIEFEIYEEDELTKVSLHNYIFTYKLINDLEIEQVLLEFEIMDVKISYSGEYIDMNQFIEPQCSQESFQLTINDIEVGGANIFYQFDENSELERVFTIKDAGTYKVTIYNEEFLFFRKTRNSNFIYDYDDKTEFTIYVLPYDFNKSLSILTESDLVPFVYGTEQKAGTIEYVCNLGAEFSSKGYSTRLKDNFVANDYCVTIPQEFALENRLPIIIIDQDGNDVTRNFSCAMIDEDGDWVIDYDSESIIAEIGEINIDSKLKLKLSEDKTYIYNGTNLVFDETFISGELLNRDDDYAELYFTGEIYKIYYRRGTVEYEITPDTGVSLAGGYSIVLKNIRCYTDKECRRLLDSRYYVSYVQYDLPEQEHYIEGREDLFICYLEIQPREIRVKPRDLVNVFYEGETIECGPQDFEYVSSDESKDDKQLVAGDQLFIDTTIKLDLEAIHMYIISTTRNTIDPSKCKVYDKDGNDITFCYRVVASSTNEKENKKFYGKLSIAKRYIVVQPGGNLDNPHIYDGEYIFCSDFTYINRYQNATEVADKVSERGYGLIPGHTLIPIDRSTYFCDVGKKFNKLSFEIKDEYNKAVSILYNVICRKADSSYLQIIPREITVVSKGCRLIYEEGMAPVVVHEIERIEGLVEGHRANFNDTNVQWQSVLVGQGAMQNVFAIDMRKAAKAFVDKNDICVSQNYEVNYVYGNLIVS